MRRVGIATYDPLARYLLCFSAWGKCSHLPLVQLILHAQTSYHWAATRLRLIQSGKEHLLFLSTIQSSWLVPHHLLPYRRYTSVCTLTYLHALVPAHATL